MAKKKFDKSKYHPTDADIQTLAETFSAYAEECRQAVSLMREKSRGTLIVSNWDSAQKGLGHVDSLVRQLVAAAKFGQLDPRIHELLGNDTTQQAAVDRLDAPPAQAQQKPRRKGGGKT